MSNLHFHQYENDDLLADALANAIAQDLHSAIELRGKGSLIVSGGSTPKKLFAHLSNLDLPWEKIMIGLCDERWVSPEHPDSNEKLVREFLMINKASKASFVGMYTSEHDIQSAQAICSQKIRSALEPLDVVVLGMGEDAHTASLFPHNPKLPEAYTTQESCIAIKPQSAPHMRMSLSLSAIVSAKRLYLHFQGEKKVALFHEARDGDDEITMPIRAILQQPDIALEVYCA